MYNFVHYQGGNEILWKGTTALSLQIQQSRIRAILTSARKLCTNYTEPVHTDVFNSVEDVKILLRPDV
jgi:hypothetical protein